MVLVHLFWSPVNTWCIWTVMSAGLPFSNARPPFHLKLMPGQCNSLFCLHMSVGIFTTELDIYRIRLNNSGSFLYPYLPHMHCCKMVFIVIVSNVDPAILRIFKSSPDGSFVKYSKTHFIRKGNMDQVIFWIKICQVIYNRISFI